MQLVDRMDERRAVDRLLAAARSGLSGALVVRGEAGIGKTSLLGHATDRAVGFQVVAIAGVESETALGFAGLHRLLLPFLSRLDHLPAPHGDVLAVAFGLASGAAADRHVVGLAALSLLADAATEGPVLCVVDDVHWLDHESIEAVGLVGRQLFADGIALLLGARDGYEVTSSLQGIPHLALAGLAEHDAISLLGMVATGPVDAEAARRLADDTSGSPLALIELAGELTSEQLGGSVPLPGPLPVSRRVEAHFLRQVESLPQATRTMLLVAAAGSGGEASAIVRAARSLGVGPDAVAPAAAAQVFELEPHPRFRHPLLRSAIYAGASAPDRRRAHRALADATDGDRDRRAWHRAAATAGPDEHVAAELELAGARARVRGGHSAAAAFLSRAAELTPDRKQRARRVLGAAEAHLAGGTVQRAERLLEDVVRDVAEPLTRAMALVLQGRTAYALGQARGTASMLMEGARALAPFDLPASRAVLLEAFAAARVTGRFTLEGEGETDVGRVARATPLPPGHQPTVADLLLDGDTALFLDGVPACVEPLRRAIELIRSDGAEGAAAGLELRAIACWAAGALGEDEALHALAADLVQRARDQGVVVWLSIGLMFLAMSELLDGSLDHAASHFAERGQLMAAMGRRSDVGELVVSAWRGDEAGTRAEAAAVTAYATAHHHGWMLIFVDYSLAVLELGLGNYEAALAASNRDYLANPFLSIVGFPHLVEAAVRCRANDTAAAAVDEYADVTGALGTPIALAFLARSRALIARGSAADALYREALDGFARCRGQLQLARTHLLYGEWLRRQRRRTDAREQLRAAWSMLSSMGADGLAERARIELSATGEHARSRTSRAGNDLTAQEGQVALLAAQGGTNAEIAAKLFLSASTVDHHLRVVFRKLDISSRRQLGAVLSQA